MPALPNLSLEWDKPSIGWTTITSVQSLNWRVGRQLKTDNFAPASLTATIWIPDGWTTGQTYPIGTRMRIKCSDPSPSGDVIFYGKVANQEFRWGQGFVSSSGKGNSDELVVTVEGYLGSLGRAPGNNYAVAAGAIEGQLSSCRAQTDVFMSYDGPTGLPMGAATVTGTWGDWIARLTTTLNGWLNDYKSEAVYVLANTIDYTGISGTNFTDQSPASGVISYQEIQFAQWADTYFTQVTVDPESFAAQTASSGTNPLRLYSIETYSASATQAADQANFLLTSFNNPQSAPFSATCISNPQFDQYYLPYLAKNGIGATVKVTFRGVDYYSVIEGVTVGATPDRVYYTFYFSPYEQNNVLILDNAVNGRLDYNRLGF